MLSFFQAINKTLWGAPVIFLLLGVHLYFTFRLGFVQKHIGKAIKLSVTSEDTKNKGFSGFGSLATTLAATLGTGNIVGISTAIALGGPGAVFWCWITGILGMSTAYAECYLSLLYRQKDQEGRSFGGPMQVLEKGLHKKHLAAAYAFFVVLASFGVGCTTQSNSMADTLHYLFKVPHDITGITAAVLVGFVLLAGSRGIERLCTKLVPFMGAFYFIASFLILIINAQYILPGLVLILRSAFTFPAIGGGILGGAVRYGIARGLFTNEAGLGSAAIAAAGSNTKNPPRQALISMSATF